MHLLRRIIYFFIILGVFSASLLTVAVSTSSGTQFLLGQIKSIKIGKITGVLGADITLENISYSDTSVQVFIKSLHFSWKPTALLTGKMQVTDLSVNGVQIQLQKNTAAKKVKKQPFSSGKIINLLRHLVLDQVHIHQFVLMSADKVNYQVDELNLLPVAQGYSLQVRSPMGNADGNIILHWTRSLNWNVNLKFSDLSPTPAMREAHTSINFLLDSEGTWNDADKNWLLKLSDVKGTFKHFPLSGQVFINYEHGTFWIHEVNLTIADSELQLAGKFSQEWNLQWQLNVPDLHKILENGSGSITGFGQFAADPKFRVHATLKSHQLKISAVKIRDAQSNFDTQIDKKTIILHLLLNDVLISDYGIPALDLNVNTQFMQDVILSQLNLQMGKTNQLQGVITMPTNTPLIAKTVSGNINVALDDLSTLARIPYVSKIAGNARGNIHLYGSFLRPLASINLLLNEGSFSVPKTGVNFKVHHLQANYTLYKKLMMTGSLSSGKGEADFNGELDTQQPDFPFTFNLQGDDLQLVNLRDYKIIISPKLTLNYANNKMDVHGKVLVPYAEITPTDFSNVVSLSEDVIFVNKQKAPPIPMNVSTNVRVTLGDHIHLSYANLNTDLSGSARITQLPGSLPIANGELTILHGKYRAYNNGLKIKEGRLIYSGNVLTDPVLDIRAFKRVKTIAMDSSQSQFTNAEQLQSVYAGSNSIEIGIWVRGTLNNPNVSLYSDQGGMSQSDILSYLLFGYPQSQITNVSGLALLNDLAGGMNGHGLQGGVTNKLQDLLGLSEFNIGSTEYFNPEDYTTGNTTAVSIGKKITKKLSLHYTVGFFHPVQVLNLKYLINKHLAVQSETSTVENGADIMYEIERG